MKNAVGEADEDVQARIQQTDDAAQKALGAADVLASKEMPNLQQSLLRVGALLGLVAFLVAAFRFIFDDLSDYLKESEAAQGTSDQRRHWRCGRRFPTG